MKEDLIRIVLNRYYQDLSISRESGVSLRDELLSVKDFDFGKYKGVAEINVDGGEVVEGFLYLPRAVDGTTLKSPDWTGASMIKLAEACKKFTRITLHLESIVSLSSKELCKYPFIYIAVDDIFDVTDLEAENLNHYLHNGGFIFLEAFGTIFDDAPPKGSPPLKKMLKDVLGSNGTLQPLPKDHMIYHSYFDFDDGPPYPRDNQYFAAVGQSPSILERITIDGRLAVLYSEKGYGRSWENDAYQRIGVNTLILALIQNGGLARRIYNRVRKSFPEVNE